MPKKLIVANWKMNPPTVGEVLGILETIHEYTAALPEPSFSLVVCPPFVFLEEVSKAMPHEILLGAQDIALSDEASQTGEVSGEMLARLGVRYVIIGHSERRWKLNESDEVTRKKLRSALKHELTPIVCVGERERTEQYADVLREQLASTLEGLSDLERGRCVIAYEPVWAISSNPGAHADTPQSAAEAIAVLRTTLPEHTILYGGSVTGENAKAFLVQPGIDGVLVGGASVRKEEFVSILRATV